MRLMRKLLDNLGDVWNKLPKDRPYLTIAKGTGLHTRVTIDEGTLYLHSVAFRRDMPQRQLLVLDGMDTTDVIATLTTMGYIAAPTTETIEDGVNSRKPYVMMEVDNVRIDGAQPTVLTAFHSKLWSQLYPIYRVLRQSEYDTEQALKQLNRTMADGTWLDFWASFFSIEREPNETDNSFVRRFTMWLFNPKTNNIAIKELLAYRLQDTNINITDRAPLQFALDVSTKYLQPDTAAGLHKILRETKGAGIEYFLNYMADPQFEDYRAWLEDQTGLPFSSLDKGSSKLQKSVTEATMPSPTDAYLGGATTRTSAEVVPVPSEALVKQLSKPFVESTMPSPVESLTSKAMSKAYVEESYPAELVTVNPGYSRASAANLPDRSTVANNVPRYVPAIFGSGLYMEEGTTNLINPDLPATSWASHPDWLIEKLGTGTYKVSAKVNAPGRNQFNSALYSPFYSASADEAVTLSCEIVEVSNPALYVYCVGFGNITTGTTFAVGARKGRMIKHNLVWGHQFGMDYTGNASGISAGDYIIIRDMQIESKNYMTSFANGTRALEAMSIPTAGLLSDAEGWTIECWAKADVSAAGYYRMPFASWNKFYVAIFSSTVVLSWTDGTQKSLSAPFTNLTGLHHWALTYDGTTAILYIDGVAVITNSNGFPVAVPAVITVGNLSTTSTYSFNGTISDIRISRIARTPSEVLAAYQANAPMQVDRQTRMKMSMNGSFAQSTPESLASTLQKSIVEDALVQPSEARTGALTRTLAETLLATVEAKAVALLMPSEEPVARTMGLIGSNSTASAGVPAWTTNQITVECMLKIPGGLAATQHRIFSKGVSGPGTLWFGLNVVNGVATLTFNIGVGTQSVSYVIPAGFGSSPVHVAGTYDKGNTTGQIFVDGVMVAQGTRPYNLNPIGSTSPVEIGWYSGIVTQQSPLFVSELRIWNTVRTAADILRDKDIELTSNPNLVAVYRMNDASDTVVPGLPAAHSATITSGAFPAVQYDRSDASAPALTFPNADVYTLPKDDALTYLELNVSELNVAELASSSGVQQDRAVATLTVGGNVVLTRPL